MTRRNPRLIPRTEVMAKLLTEPYEVLTATGIALYGLTVIVTGQVPPSLAAIAPHFVVRTWAGLMGAAGALTVTGMFRSKRLELGGNVMLGGLVLAYAVTVVYRFGIAGIAGVAFAGPLGTAALVTAYRIIVAERVHRIIERTDDH